MPEDHFPACYCIYDVIAIIIMFLYLNTACNVSARSPLPPPSFLSPCIPHDRSQSSGSNTNNMAAPLHARIMKYKRKSGVRDHINNR